MLAEDYTGLAREAARHGALIRSLEIGWKTKPGDRAKR
jgi:hypothetical protein